MAIGISISFMDEIGLIAKDAGAVIMKIYKEGIQVDTKSDDSPVTQADRQADALITHAIKKRLTGKWPIISEEAFADGNSPDISGAEAFWLVDPLDGTKEFIKKGSDFTVNIALIENGLPIAGVVYAPAQEKIWYGCAVGAFVEEKGQKARQIHCRETPPEGIAAVVSKSHRTPETDDFLKDYTIAEEVSVGSSLKFCIVAEGKADLYPRLGRTMEWDTAAGHAVLRFAGGECLTMEETDLRYGKPGFENPHFFCRKKSD